MPKPKAAPSHSNNNVSALTQRRARFVARTLTKLYPDPKPPLDYSSHFTLLISVLLSANSTDKAVNKVTPHLFARASTPKQMMNLTPKQIETIIKPCGLAPQKSKAIHTLSKILHTKYQGAVPQAEADLEALPGVGHKTASVVRVQAFKIPAFPVDTHIHRLAQRWQLSSGRNVKTTEQDLKKLFPKKNWGRLHLQFIFFGREYCKARYHDETTCPICSKLPSNKAL
ncbi:endonuclease III [Spirochaetota bacterium]|nr:endonuclease III [Spirochaetota bacterium]